MEKLPKDQWHTVINAAPALEIFKDGIERLESGGCFCIFSGFTDNTGFVAKEIINVLNDIHYRQLRISRLTAVHGNRCGRHWKFFKIMRMNCPC
jgi:hypothetical protein